MASQKDTQFMNLRTKKQVRFAKADSPPTEAPSHSNPPRSLPNSAGMGSRKRSYDLFRPIFEPAPMDIDPPSTPSDSNKPVVRSRRAVDTFKGVVIPPIASQGQPSSTVSFVSPTSAPVVFNASPSVAMEHGVSTSNTFSTASHCPPSTSSFSAIPSKQAISFRPTIKLPARPRPAISFRPTIKLPARPRKQPPDATSVNPIAYTSPDGPSVNPITRSTPPPDAPSVNPITCTPPLPPVERFVFNTDGLLASRKLSGSWQGNRNASEWILSREELHAEQVELDRNLPGEMEQEFYPSFAISPRDLQSFHRYIMSRYDVQDYDEYTHLLALYRNTRAIEAQKARTRFTELNEAASAIAKVRLSIIKALQDRHSSS